MSVMYSYEFTAEGPGPDVDCLDDAIRIGELGELYNGRVKTLPECCAVRSSGGDPGPLPDLIVDRCSRAADMTPDKWLEASFLVNYGCIRPILHMTELFPTLRFRGSFQRDMECEEAHYEFEARQGDFTELELVRYKRTRLIPKSHTSIFHELNEISAVLQQLETRAFHTADHDLAGDVAKIRRVLDQIDARPAKETHAEPVKSVTELEKEIGRIFEKLNARVEGSPLFCSQTPAEAEHSAPAVKPGNAIGRLEL